MNESAPTLWVIVGATGTGKSGLSLDLAERLNARGRETGGDPGREAGREGGSGTYRGAEIVNADAMQLYRGMDIGTAKLRPEERRGIPHHLFDVLEPSEEGTVAWYQPRARAVIDDIHARGNDAILVGGSGLYVSSVIYDFQFPPRDDELRASLEREAEERGIPHLLARLREQDPATADAVDAKNPRRVIRALEVALLGGDAQVTLPSEPRLWLAGAGEAARSTRIIGVSCERSVLTDRLDRRVEQMWADGLVDEARALIPHGIERGKTASRAIGYAQALAQLRGEMTREEAIAETQRLTRRYARRQVSWFKRYPGVQWVDGTGGAFLPG